MSKWLQEVVTVGGMTGTRAEYVEYLMTACGWNRQQAVRIACYAKSA